ncbi:hypothetical protein ATCC90586_008207 [Pythium insidiosum]|nr:hypothetical protein ATCC90586_008207 [Pythium insidiosum]
MAVDSPAAVGGSPQLSPVHGGADRRRTQSARELQIVTTSPTPSSKPLSPSAASSPTPSSSRGSFSSSRSNSLLSLFATNPTNGASEPNASPLLEHVVVIKVVYPDPGPLFMDLYSRADGHGAFVKSFRRKPDGSMGNAEASGQVRLNDMLFSINDAVVTDLPFPSIIQTAKTATFPCTLVFHSRLPPSSPTARSVTAAAATSPAKSGATWTAKFGQMMNESAGGIKRSGSFERKKDADASPARRTSTVSALPLFGGSTPPPPVPSATGDTAGKQTKNWGDAVKNSDGMKNLLRMMGGRGRPEEDRDTVEGWLERLELRPETIDGCASIVVMTASGRTLGVREDDANEFSMTWFRKTATQELVQIKGARSGRYFPSVDDVDSKLSLRCQSNRFANLTRVVETHQPIRIDPAVKDMVEILLEAGAGSFSATLASNEHDSFQIKIATDRVTLVKVSEEEEEAGVVVTMEYHSHLQVLLDPTDPHRFTLKVQELGNMLGNKEGDSCDIKKKQALAGVSCYFLVAQNPQHRDILALLIRRFRAGCISVEEEEQAQRDEMNLFVDPASSLLPVSMDMLAASVAGGGAGTNAAGHRGSLSTKSNHESTTPVARLFGQLTPVAGRFSDLFGLDADNEGTRATVSEVGATGRSNGTHPSPNKAAQGSSADSGGFLHDRLAAQEKEIAMLQEKLASMSVLLKTTEHEKTELSGALEVKDKRIESQQLRLLQMEKVNVQLAAQTREIHSVRRRLEEETRQHLLCQQQLDRALQAEEDARYADRSSQTERDQPDELEQALRDAVEQNRSLQAESEKLREQVRIRETAMEAMRREIDRVAAERNSFRVRLADVAKELKRVVGAHRSIADVEAQLADRSNLAAQLAVAKAEVKRAADEMQEYRDALDLMKKQQHMIDKEKGTQRLVSQNVELQRLVQQLTESLNETREQMGALKKINTALVDRLQRDDPDFRGSILESPPMSPQSVASSYAHPRFSDDDDDDDEEDDGEMDVNAEMTRYAGVAGLAGAVSPAAVRPQRPTPTPSAAADDSDDDAHYGDAVDHESP